MDKDKFDLFYPQGLRMKKKSARRFVMRNLWKYARALRETDKKSKTLMKHWHKCLHIATS